MCTLSVVVEWNTGNAKVRHWGAQLGVEKVPAIARFVPQSHGGYREAMQQPLNKITATNEKGNTAPATTVVAVVVGGWLKDQTARTLQPALRANGIVTVSPPGLDDWRAAIGALAKQVLREARQGRTGEVALAMIGHSFGAQAVCNAVGELARDGIFPVFVALIDPVSTKPGIPRPIVLNTEFQTRGGQLQVYYRKFLLGPIRANIVDERGVRLAGLWNGSRRVGFGHNTMCHCGELVAEVVEMARALRC